MVEISYCENVVYRKKTLTCYQRKTYYNMHEKFLTNANHTEILEKNPHSEFVLPQRTHMDVYVEWRAHRIWNVDT